MKQYKRGTNVCVYLSEAVLDELDKWVSEFDSSRSSLVEEAIRKYLLSLQVLKNGMEGE